ncbi:MAG: hypothetical protein O6920_04495 [Chloroflexi bacterium]|nr:hypothetical protein [Chloroflexota bacterium]
MADETYKGDVLQKIAGVSLIVGAILTGVFNAIFPRVGDPGDVGTVLIKLGENETLAQIASVGVAVGIWLVLAGIAGVYRSISTGAAAPWARLGFYAFIVSAATWTASFAITLGQAGAAGDWLDRLAAGDQTGAEVSFTVGATLYTAATSFFAMAVFANWTAIILLGIALSLNTLYPKWLGWVAIILGVVTIPAVGVPLAFDGLTQTVDTTFMILAGLTTLWILVLGIWITRREITAL